MNGLSDDRDEKDRIRAAILSAWQDANKPLAGDGESNIAPGYYRYALCTGNGDALVDVLLFDASLGRVPSMASFIFQPAYVPLDTDHARAIERALADPRIGEILASVRALDASYASAVNGWRYDRE